jgi:hypothetical protein
MSADPDDYLKQLRGEIADAVTGITTYDHVPERPSLPCAFVLPGSPYIEGGETFGENYVRFELVVLTHPTLNSQETDDLDRRILQFRRELHEAGWRTETVSQPRIEDAANGAEVLATGITVAALVTFE